MRVDFVIIGAQKSGTTSLAAQLGKHPSVCFCAQKEPHFFSTTRYDQGLESYHSLFKPQAGQLLGEGSTSYTFFPEYPDTVKRLHAYNPGLKFIYIMRQPVQRIVSQYAHAQMRGLVKRPLPAAVTEDPTYLNRSCYAMQIRKYLEYFALQDFALILFEEFVNNQRGVLQEIATFLNISPDFYSEIGQESRNRSLALPPKIAQPLLPFATLLPGSVRKILRAILIRTLDQKLAFTHEMKQDLWSLLEDDVHDLEKLMGRSLGIWREPLAR